MIFITQKGHYIVIEEKSESGLKRVTWIFFLIALFILILFPIFGMSMRYRTGSTFLKVFSALGIVAITLGVIVIAWGFLMLLCTRSFKAICLMLLGFGLIIFGSFFLNPGYFGVVAHGEEVPRGYS